MLCLDSTMFNSETLGNMYMLVHSWKGYVLENIKKYRQS